VLYKILTDVALVMISELGFWLAHLQADSYYFNAWRVPWFLPLGMADKMSWCPFSVVTSMKKRFFHCGDLGKLGHLLSFNGSKFIQTLSLNEIGPG